MKKVGTPGDESCRLQPLLFLSRHIRHLLGHYQSIDTEPYMPQAMNQYAQAPTISIYISTCHTHNPSSPSSNCASHYFTVPLPVVRVTSSVPRGPANAIRSLHTAVPHTSIHEAARAHARPQALPRPRPADQCKPLPTRDVTHGMQLPPCHVYRGKAGWEGHG